MKALRRSPALKQLGHEHEDASLSAAAWVSRITDAGPMGLPSVATGLFVSKPHVIFATVRMIAQHEFQMCSDRCGIFEFADRSNESARRLQAELAEFLSSRAITDIVMRSGAIRGRYNQHPLAFKVEAILQVVIPNITVAFASPVAIDRWVASAAPCLPIVKGHKTARVRDAQDKAIVTAAFGCVVRFEADCGSSASA